ncbi:hypothetical protein [Leifsonia xyli]|uniref:hypothetical protein n=1 Tax=Leifsonia xyli TaxID=1575 RepID=UPI003D66A82D
MLTKLNPALSPSLLSALSDVRSGQWVAVTSLPVEDGRSTIHTHDSLEDVADALFATVPVSSRTPLPLVGWLADAADDAHLDAFFAFQGIARDAERRELEMARILDLPADIWSGAAVVVTVPSAERFAFFVCVGRGDHAVAPLLAAAPVLAA